MELSWQNVSVAQLYWSVKTGGDDEEFQRHPPEDGRWAAPVIFIVASNYASEGAVRATEMS